jgi:hypothetical protein
MKYQLNAATWALISKNLQPMLNTYDNLDPAGIAGIQKPSMG